MGEETKKLVHLGIIADGNRRWAKERGLPTIEGHKKGMETIETLTEAAAKAGIKYLTFYVFSTENWGRSEGEVSYIMKLVETQILKYAKKLAAKNARLLVLGSKEKLAPRTLELLEKAEAMTAEGTGLTACFCFNYGGEQEIADAANAAMSVLMDGMTIDELVNGTKENPLEITPEMIRANLYHPEVDMVVRTSGEERLSGFMLWRTAYSEFYFMKKYFPEMTAADMGEIIAEYQKRNRRFGK